ncbi:MAG: putative phage abortive infection protein [Gammaproteobacteria bacterium]|nr:putative phage abortive infection protein [Gammaproteobacteria bacterium]MBU1416682.1 putative phage abortive infection protein [Gammaproteobacteria bacterium]
MNTDSRSKPETYFGLVVLLLLVFVIWGISGWALHALPDRGTFGDMFGAINALFSGLAFASLVYTVFLQRRELTLQRQELSLTRSELEGQKLQLSAQNDVLRIQNFENTFFQLLKLLNDIVNSIDLVGSDSNVIRGRDCFNTFFRRFRNAYNYSKKDHPNDDACARALIAYEIFYKDIQGEIGHYFRTLYNIIKFVHQSDIQNKRFYTNLVRAQLSSQELSLLFYNCASALGSQKFKPLVEEYSLLKTLPRESLLAPLEHSAMYADSAYGVR